MNLKTLFHCGLGFHKHLEVCVADDWDACAGRKAGVNLYTKTGHHAGFHVDIDFLGKGVQIAIYDTRHV